MELKQSDRDSLRVSQQKINPKVIIGGIIEHKTQDPRRYKELSREEQGVEKSPHKNENGQSSTTTTTRFTTNFVYRSRFINSEPKKKGLIEKSTKINEDLPITPDDVQANSWLNMDQIEYDKLEWLSEKYQKSIHLEEQHSSTTKFDKEGRVVSDNQLKESKKPETNLTDINQENEINDQAHDINELINLLGSTYPRHTTYSLIVIRKIANLANCGFYDGSFDENIHELLIKTCLLRVRSLMDSHDMTTCLAALKCLKCLLCNTDLDEIILDRIHPVICDNIDNNIWLQNKQNKKEFTEEMKDQECAEIDPLLALIERTNLIQRILYLLSISIPLDHQNSILDILIRLARHSRKVCSIINNNAVLFVVTELFLTPTITSQTDDIRGLSIKALKLIRIVAQAFVESVVIRDETTKFNKLPDKLIDLTRAYFFIDYYESPKAHKKSLVLLHIESLRIIKVLSKIKDYSNPMLDLIALGQSNIFNSFKSLVNLKSTDEIQYNISIEWQSAAHLIDLLGHCKQMTIQKENFNFIGTFLSKYIKPLMLQWLNDIIKEKFIPHLDVSIALTTAFKHLNISPNQEKLNKLMIHDTTVGTNNKFLKLLIREAHERSSLAKLSEISGNLRDPDMLRSYGTLNFNTTNEQKFIICPLLDKNSPYLLLNMFITKLHEATVAYNLHFINDICLIRYIRSSTLYYNLNKNYEFQVRQSSIAQYEVKLIANLLLLVVKYYLDFTKEIFSLEDSDSKIENQLDEPEDFEQVREDCYSNIIHYTVGLIGLVNSDNPDGAGVRDKLFEDILFNRKLQHRLTKESYMKKLKCFESLKLWQNIGFRDLHKNSQHTYELNEKQYQTLKLLYKTLDLYDRNWLFQPIVNYYKNQICWQEREPKTKYDNWFNDNLISKNKTADITGCKDSDIISIVLEFHFTLLIYCPSYTFITVKPNVEDYLCLVGCLFLHDDIFLDESLSKSIKYNVRMILNDCLNASEGKFKTPFKDASKKIEPLNNLPLADFFNRLIDQYESVSYGDLTFANFLLLFIATGSDLIFRKKLFQERMETCLSVLRITSEDLWSPKELFFNIRESNQEMKLLLKKSIPYIPKGSFLLEYAIYHS